MKPTQNVQCEAGILAGPRGKMPRLRRSGILPLMLLLSISAWAANINGVGVSLNLPTTDLSSGGAQTNGAGGRLLSAGTPARGMVSLNTLESRLIIEPLYAAPGGASGGAPAADFTADALSGGAPLEVQFTDLSSGGWYEIMSWTWDFGDGSPMNSERNPQHTYATPGIYTVTLTILTAGGSASELKDNYITVSQGVPATGRWGLIILMLVFLSEGGMLAHRRNRRTGTK
ncbi:MAG TPA: PKD domain-containing protein [Candidatus Hydrogenedentes bacterium]|nr:PKD domain-containing protein [Candidatus Hydrogenedentota bacterium]